MSSNKPPMSTGYRLVFLFSILMIIVVIIVGSFSGSKTAGFGIWYWGYIIWKMYKRDNVSLVSLQKFVLWFQALAFSLALVVLLFSDSDMRRFVDVTPAGLLIIAVLSMGVTFFLYKFFKKQQNVTVTPKSFVVNTSIEDRFWEQASRELKGDIHEATWAKAVASSEGDEAKARAFYIKTRSSDLQNTYLLSNEHFSPSKENAEGFIKEEFKSFSSIFNSISKIAIVGIFVLIGYVIYESTKSSNNGSLTSSTSVTKSSQVAKPTISNNPIKSIDEVGTICYVYWDGRRWQSGKTEGDGFYRFKMARYGVHVMTLSLPIQMADNFNLRKDSAADVDIYKGEIGDFMKKHWYQLEELCNFR